MEAQRAEESSGSSLSPVPSPHTNGKGFAADTIAVAIPQFESRKTEGVLSSNSAHAADTNASAKHTSATTTPVPTKAARKPRKKKDADAETPIKPNDTPKEKKPRKPRTVNPNGPASSRKKQKIEADTAAQTPIPNAPSPQMSRQPTIAEMVGHFQPPAQPSQQIIAPQNTAITSLREGPALSTPPVASRPASSGQRYDPIRGMTIESVPTPNRTPPLQPSPNLHRAIASPTVSSLMNPVAIPSAPLYPIQSDPHSPPQLKATNLAATYSSPASINPTDAIRTQAVPHSTPSIVPAVSGYDGIMDVDSVREHPKPEFAHPKLVEDNQASKVTSTAPTPKAQRPTPPTSKALGSGLLSSSDLFGGPQSKDDSSSRGGINIELNIPLNPAGNNTINIAQEIMKKYGKEAINPRAAAHREQLLQVAAAANRLEQGSGDEMSVDLSEMENDSNVEMGGMGEDKSETADGQPRKRRKKVEEYDKEDDFIDDTELAWQEQAAVAKDGFFVYSGPLVKEGDKASVESSAPSGRGRGRGRGRGSRGGAAGVTHATLAAKTSDTPGGATTSTTGVGRGRGRGGRGGGTGATRKPRITKADKEKMDAEKMQRERAAASLGGQVLLSAPLPSAAATSVQ